MRPDAMIFVFWMLSFKPTFSLSSFIKRLFSSFSLYAVRVVSLVYLRLLIFLLAILIPACASSSPAFLMMYSAYKLNKQGDNIQSWRTPFPIWNQSVVPCLDLTVASWSAYTFLKRQIRWSGIPISSEFSTVYCDPHSQSPWHSQKSRNRCFSGTLLLFQWSSGYWHLISGSSAFSKSTLNIWKFTVHILLKPGLENFQHYFTSVWDACNCALVWAFFGIAFLRDWNENWPLPVLCPLLSFPNLLAYWVQHFHSIIF